MAQGFEHRWNFPHCVGALDGKHITVQAPASSGSDYYNYKGYFSIVLLAIVDSMYNFLYVNVGSQGRLSDGGVLSNSTFSQAMRDGTLNLPSSHSLPGRDIATPYIFVADDAFPLTENIMKPYQGQQRPGSNERIFNYRLSRARRVVESVFGIVSGVFRVLRKPMLVKPDCAKKVTLACVYLHNFLRRSSTSQQLYTPPRTFDSYDMDYDTIIPGSWREVDLPPLDDTLIPLEPLPENNTNVNGSAIRREFTEYFISDRGRVSWQDRHM